MKKPMEERSTPVSVSNVRVFRATILLVITVVTVAVFLWTGTTIVRLVEAESLSQARSYTSLVIAARSWNASTGGVYVRKSDLFPTNPYLLILGADPDVTLSDGTVLTMRNPAAMTREIGEHLTMSDGISSFKLTSLDPVNPDNAPDPWEANSLRRLDAGSAEEWTVGTSDDGVQVFRYMRPLYVKQDCLTCHGSSGYEVDDLRGAISVTLPYEETARSLRNTRQTLVAICASVLAGLWAFTLMASRMLSVRLADASHKLELAANTDSLTGVWNRGYAVQRLGEELERARRLGHGLGVMLFDIDFFKRINDTFGHAAGDDALRQLAALLESSVRAYDVVCRMGGEEFLVIAPDIDHNGLVALAERMRADVEASAFQAAGDGTMTVSAGLALADSSAEETVDDLIARADGAMYDAKQAGRNRVAVG